MWSFYGCYEILDDPIRGMIPFMVVRTGRFLPKSWKRPNHNHRNPNPTTFSQTFNPQIPNPNQP